jgi:FO synthase subunit 2
MMYGTVDTVADRAAHLLKLREIQEKTSGFTEFVPLPFVHGVAPISKIVPSGPSGADDLRAIATARLVLGSSIPNVQVSWVKMGIKLAQIGLTSGANDFGGTLMEENISKSAGANYGSRIEPEAIRRIIRDLGRVPAQRNTLYDLIG